MKLTKPRLAALEKLFVADAEDWLVQSKAKVYRELEQAGFCEYLVTKSTFMGLPMTVEGWAITVLGHMTYCMKCKEEMELQEVPNA